MEGDFCYQFTPTTQSVQAYFALLTDACLDAAASNTIAPCPVTPTCALIFPDVQPRQKFYNEIMSLAALKVVSGYGDSNFRPNDGMTRGLAAKVLVRAFNLPLEAPVDAGNGPHFNDVPQDSPYYAEVEAAYRKGLVDGYKDGTFRPEQVITRGALVKMVVQAAVEVSGWELVQPTRPTFTDVSADSPFYIYVETAAAHNILARVATSGANFQVEKEATRGESAALIARAMPALVANLPESLEDLLKGLLGATMRR